jgi:hypothetical protein
MGVITEEFKNQLREIVKDRIDESDRVTLTEEEANFLKDTDTWVKKYWQGYEQWGTLFFNAFKYVYREMNNTETVKEENIKDLKERSKKAMVEELLKGKRINANDKIDFDLTIVGIFHDFINKYYKIMGKSDENDIIYRFYVSKDNVRDGYDLNDLSNLLGEKVHVFGKVSKPYSLDLSGSSVTAHGNAFTESPSEHDVDIIKIYLRKKHDGFLTLDQYAEFIFEKREEKFGQNKKKGDKIKAFADFYLKKANRPRAKAQKDHFMGLYYVAKALEKSVRKGKIPKELEKISNKVRIEALYSNNIEPFHIKLSLEDLKTFHDENKFHNLSITQATQLDDGSRIIYDEKILESIAEWSKRAKHSNVSQYFKDMAKLNRNYRLMGIKNEKEFIESRKQLYNLLEQEGKELFPINPINQQEVLDHLILPKDVKYNTIEAEIKANEICKVANEIIKYKDSWSSSRNICKVDKRNNEFNVNLFPYITVIVYDRNEDKWVIQLIVDLQQSSYRLPIENEDRLIHDIMYFDTLNHVLIKKLFQEKVIDEIRFQTTFDVEKEKIHRRNYFDTELISANLSHAFANNYLDKDLFGQYSIETYIQYARSNLIFELIKKFGIDEDPKIIRQGISSDYTIGIRNGEFRIYYYKHYTVVEVRPSSVEDFNEVTLPNAIKLFEELFDIVLYNGLTNDIKLKNMNHREKYRVDIFPSYAKSDLYRNSSMLSRKVRKGLGKEGFYKKSIKDLDDPAIEDLVLDVEKDYKKISEKIQNKISKLRLGGDSFIFEQDKLLNTTHSHIRENEF